MGEIMTGMMTDDEKIRLMPCVQGDADLHSHNFLELVYVVSGSAIHTLNNVRSKVKKGDYFIIDYGMLHKYDTIEGESFEIVNCLFKPEIIDKTLIHCLSFQDLIHHYLIRFNYQSLTSIPTKFVFTDEDGSIALLILKLQREYDAHLPGCIELMRCYLIEILIIAMRKISNQDADVLYNNYSGHIMRYVDENYMKPITLGEIAADLSFSVPYLCKRFRQETGASFTEYLQKKRMEQSCRLLANTNKKITEIAELVGYSDVKFFNRVFKKYINKTPRQFKKMLDKSDNIW